MEKLENNKKELEYEINKKKNELIIKSNSNFTDDIVNMKTKINQSEEQINEYKFNIKLLKNKIKELSLEKKTGKKKYYNWINTIFMILTLGLLYWTKYTNINYFLLIYKKKILKFEEKIVRLQNKIEKLKSKLKSYQEKYNKEIGEEKKIIIEKTEIEINKITSKLEIITNKIKNLQKNIKKEDIKINAFDKNISKVENKLIELEAQKTQIEKYSYKKVEKAIKDLIENIKEKEKELIEISDKIKSQKTEINGEFIFEF